MLRRAPGPRILPYIGCAWTYFPIIGHGDDPERLHEVYQRKYEKYGPVVYEVFGKKRVLSVYDPSDIRKVLTSTRKHGCARRYSHDILKEFRRSRPDLFSSVGLIPSQDEEWFNLRKTFGDIFLYSEVKKYYPAIHNVAEEFVNYLGLLAKRSGHNEVKDVIEKLHHWALENICKILLGIRLDQFSFRRKDICDEIISTGLEFVIALKKAEVTSSWNYYENKVSRQVKKCDLFFYNYIKNHVHEIESEVSNYRQGKSEEPCLLAKYLRMPGVDVRDAITTASDILVAGHLSTAFAAAAVLYNLGQNLDKQDVLYEILCDHVQKLDDPLTYATVHKKVPYLDDCYREALRLNPVTIGIGRALVTDEMYDGILYKAGTNIITQNQVASRLPAYIDSPMSFRPERWNGTQCPVQSQSISYFLSLPFGVQPRICLGKSLTEIQTLTLIAMIVRRYRIITTSPDNLTVKTLLLNVPDQSIDIQFIPRKD